MNSFRLKLLLVGWLGALALAQGCAGRQEGGNISQEEHFGTSFNYPRFHSFREFFHDLGVALGVMRGRFQGRPVDLSWMTPAFREKVCLTVTLADHCGA